MNENGNENMNHESIESKFDPAVKLQAAHEWW